MSSVVVVVEVAEEEIADVKWTSCIALISRIVSLLFAIAIIVIGVYYLDAECDEPIQEWLIALGCVSIVELIFAIANCKEKYMALYVLWECAGLGLWIAGLVWTFRSDQCQHTVHMFAFVLNIVMLSILGIAILFECGRIMIHCI